MTDDVKKKVGKLRVNADWLRSRMQYLTCGATDDPVDVRAKEIARLWDDLPSEIALGLATGMYGYKISDNSKLDIYVPGWVKIT